jgi:transposase
LYFQTHPGTYTDTTLIAFLRALKRHFRGQRVVLIWDGLGAHRSHRMTTYLGVQRAWLHVERLPAYAPDLNPVELLWGNLKTRELANLCPADIGALRHPVRSGCGRIRRQPALAFAFLQHAGIGL